MSENFSNLRNDEEEICNSQPISLPSSKDSTPEKTQPKTRPPKYKGQRGQFRSVEEIDAKYRHVFTYPYFNLVQSRVIDDALYSDKSMVVCAPTGSGKTVIFEMAILQLLMELEDKNNTDDFKIIYMAPVKALCTERITEWYSKFTKLGLLCIEVTGDTDVDFPQLKPYRIIITTPEKWDMLTRRWMEHNLVKIVKLFLIDEVHILNDEARGPVLEAVVSRMKTVESSVRSGVRLVAVSATVSNPQDVAAWLGAGGTPAVHYKFGDECRPVKLTRVVEGYPCSSGTSIFKFDIILNYKLWPIIQKYYNGKPTLIFCNTRKSVMLTAETLSREITVGFSPEQRNKLTALASTIKNKKIQSLVLSGVGCHHAGLLFEERTKIEQAFRNRDLPILITTTTLAMGVNLPAHLVIIKNTQQYVNGAYQEYSISTVLQMVGRAGRPQYDRTATAVIMTRMNDKARYQSLVGGCEPLQSFLHKRLAENINSEIALGTIGDVSQCVQWLNSTFLRVRAAQDPKRYLGLPPSAPAHLITKKIEELCVRAMNGLESSGLVTMDELSCIESTEAGRLMSLHYLDLETMKLIMKVGGTESLEQLLWLVCESHELSDMHLRVDERRCLNALNRNNSAPTIRYQMKGKISSRQMKLNCIIQSVLGCLPIPDPSLNQEALKIMRTADRVCKCLVSYVTRPNLISQSPRFYAAIWNSLILAKCVTAHLWENSLYVSRQLRGIGPTFSTLLASAGKTSFRLLDESHPRDLERIMNKGPPAGNILRKQISLLPKYNITITPINEQSIRIQLSLLNQSYLAENIESLTAGSRHKSYIVVGDSENFLLYFSSFKDSDLINIYDGNISFEVNRKYLQEHKVTAHCISSSFVGIDDQCEYLFKDINPLPISIEKTCKETVPKISPNRQTFITDVFKERKRKSNDNDSTHFKEKKKRDSLLIDKFKILNKSFEKTSKDIKEKCNESKDNSDAKPQYEITPKVAEPNDPVNNEIDEIDFLNDFDFEDIDNERINNLLNEIEGEVNKPSTSKICSMGFNDTFQTGCNKLITKNQSKLFKKDKANINIKNNYTFIDRLEKKNSEYENDNSVSNKESGFSDTVKCYIQQYLQKAQNNIKSTVIDSINLNEKGIDLENIRSLESEKIAYEKDIDSINVTKSVSKNPVNEKNIDKQNCMSSESKNTVHGKNIGTQNCTSSENKNTIHEKNISTQHCMSLESKNTVHGKNTGAQNCTSSGKKNTIHDKNIINSRNKETVNEKDIKPQNLTILESKETILYDVIDSQTLDLNINTPKSGISKNNLNIIDLTNVSSQTSPNLMMPSGNIEFNSTRVENKMNEINTNADKIISYIEDYKNSNNEYSLMPYVPQIISRQEINSSPKTQTLEASTDSYKFKIQKTSDSSNNLNKCSFFSADSTLVSCEQKFVSSKSMNTKERHTFQKESNDFNVKENHDNLNKSSSFTIHAEQNNSDINIQNPNTEKKNRNIRTYSFNATKTIGVHKENISKICTLKVALDVTEIVHNGDDELDSQNETRYNIQNLDEDNKLPNFDDMDTLSQKERNIGNMQCLNTSDNEKLILNQQNNKISSDISDKLKNKEPTLKDILERYATSQNVLEVQDKGLEHYTQIKKTIKEPELKPKRKYRISDLDTIDIILPESLVPSQNQVIYKPPKNRSIERKPFCSEFTEEKPKPYTIIENSVPGLDKTCMISEVEDNYEEHKIGSYLDEPEILSNFDLSPAELDPKTLLQSLNNEEIIPPPPEFCDNDVVSPKSFLELSTSNSNDSHNAHSSPDNDILGTTFDDDLRSTETDARIFSRKYDDYLLCNPNSAHNTMIHGNFVESNESDFPQSRLSKLSQFKFKRKDMLKK